MWQQLSTERDQAALREVLEWRRRLCEEPCPPAEASASPGTLPAVLRKQGSLGARVEPGPHLNGPSENGGPPTPHPAAAAPAAAGVVRVDVGAARAPRPRDGSAEPGPPIENGVGKAGEGRATAAAAATAKVQQQQQRKGVWDTAM
ncbi:unnamed protein product [Lampetra fluviatilis]